MPFVCLEGYLDFITVKGNNTKLAILNVIQRLTMFRDDETYMAYLYSVRNEVYGIDESSDEV